MQESRIIAGALDYLPGKRWPTYFCIYPLVVKFSKQKIVLVFYIKH